MDQTERLLVRRRSNFPISYPSLTDALHFDAGIYMSPLSHQSAKSNASDVRLRESVSERPECQPSQITSLIACLFHGHSLYLSLPPSVSRLSITLSFLFDSQVSRLSSYLIDHRLACPMI
jgi:hypothetical protein